MHAWDEQYLDSPPELFGSESIGRAMASLAHYSYVDVSGDKGESIRWATIDGMEPDETSRLGPMDDPVLLETPALAMSGQKLVTPRIVAAQIPAALEDGSSIFVGWAKSDAPGAGDQRLTPGWVVEVAKDAVLFYDDCGALSRLFSGPPKSGDIFQMAVSGGADEAASRLFEYWSTQPVAQSSVPSTSAGRDEP